jgi:hypothetical protein
VSKSYVKLKNVGDAATFTVLRCAPGTGNYPDVEFEDAEGRVYAVPKASADKQLDRLNVANYPDIQGRAITISRGENKKAPDKPFWNIEWAAHGNGSGGASAPAAGGAPKSGGGVATALPPQPPAPSPEKITGKYEKAVEFVLSHLVPKLKAAGVTPTHEGVSAMAATVFLNAQGK